MFDRATYQRNWRANNPGAQAEAMLRYRYKNPEKVLFDSARNRAEARGLEFNLRVEDIVIPAVCPVLGIPISLDLGIGRSRRNRPGSPSLDRIDPRKGYTKGNIRVISWRANDLKKDATVEELRLLLADAKDR